MILKHKAELAGRVKLQISDGERGTIDYPWQDNMILDQGFVQLLTSAQQQTPIFLNYISVGASSQPVQPTDTGCISPIARVLGNSGSNVRHGWSTAGLFGWSRCTVSFPRGVAAGNISELTTNYANSNDSAMARALVRDAQGNPTTITVLSDEVLTVVWELRRWWVSPDPHVINYTIDGIEHETTASYTLVQNMDKSDIGLGSGGSNPFNGTLLSNFVGQRLSTFNETQGNPSIAAVNTRFTSYGYCIFPSQNNYVTFTPPIPKTNEFVCNIKWELTLTRRAP